MLHRIELFILKLSNKIKHYFNDYNNLTTIKDVIDKSKFNYNILPQHIGLCKTVKITLRDISKLLKDRIKAFIKWKVIIIKISLKNYYDIRIKDYYYNTIKTFILVNVRRVKLIHKFNSDIFGTVLFIAVLFFLANYLLLHSLFINYNLGLMIIGIFLYVPVIVLIHWLITVDIPTYIKRLEAYHHLFYVDSIVFTSEEMLIKKSHRLKDDHYINKCLDSAGGTATTNE